MQPRERLGRVVERRPVADRGADRLHLGGGRLEAEVAADSLERPPEQLAVAQVLAGLELGLVAGVGLEQLVVAALTPCASTTGRIAASSPVSQSISVP